MKDKGNIVRMELLSSLSDYRYPSRHTHRSQ